MRKWILGISTAGLVVLLLAVVERTLSARPLGPVAVLAYGILALLAGALAVSAALWGTRLRESLANAWLTLMSVLVTYLAGDLLAGRILIERLSPTIVRDEFRHHKLAPDSVSMIRQREFSYLQRVNSLGLRGEERSALKPRDGFRILMLGDSFTMGKGVKDTETFSVLLENSLQERHGHCAGREIQVLNAGVDSYSPILSYIQLKEELLRLQPDLVVLNLDASDLLQESVYRRNAKFGADGEPLAVPPAEVEKMSLAERLTAWIDQNMYLTRLVLHEIAMRADAGEMTVRYAVTRAGAELIAHTLDADSADRDDQWASLFDSIERLRQTARNHGAEFILTIYPWGHEVDDREWIPGRYQFMPRSATPSDRSRERVRDFAAQRDIALADMYPLFREHDGNELLYFGIDMHWTSTGHVVMARGLEAFLRDSTFKQWCTGAGDGGGS